jgi:hypothetical protein
VVASRNVAVAELEGTMTIRLLLLKDKLKCYHHGVVLTKPAERHINDEQSKIITDQDLLHRPSISGCTNDPKCLTIDNIEVGYSKQLHTKNGEIPLLRNLKAKTNIHALVTVDDSDSQNEARKGLAKFLREVEGKYHDAKKVGDHHETNEGITHDTWNRIWSKLALLDSPEYPSGTFMEMKPADWDAMYNYIWNEVATRTNTSSTGVQTSAQVNDPAVLSELVEWQFNGNFLYVHNSLWVAKLQTMLAKNFGQVGLIGKNGNGDGRYGPQTIDAINAAARTAPTELLDKLLGMRDDYNKWCDNYEVNKDGWDTRLNKLAHLLKGVRGVLRR